MKREEWEEYKASMDKCVEGAPEEERMKRLRMMLQEDLGDESTDAGVLTSPLDALQYFCGKTAELNGWHEKPRSIGEDVALIHSEVSELLEVHRNNRWGQDCEKTNEITQEEEEIADILIRIFDFVYRHPEIDLAKALLVKMELNTKRPRRHGGKAL